MYLFNIILHIHCCSTTPVSVCTEMLNELNLDSMNVILNHFHHTCEIYVAGCFSILPATDLVPGDIVEVSGEFVKSTVCEQYSESMYFVP